MPSPIQALMDLFRRPQQEDPEEAFLTYYNKYAPQEVRDKYGDPSDKEHPIRRISEMLKEHRESPDLRFTSQGVIRADDPLWDVLKRKGDSLATPQIGQDSLPRSVFDKKVVSDEELRDMGFTSSLVAVPERGQKKIVTLRHPFSNMHIHDHGNRWMTHEDSYPSMQMLDLKNEMTNTKSDASAWDKIKTKIRHAKDAAPHVLFEGLPGYLSWGRNTLIGAPTFMELIDRAKEPGQLNLGRAAAGVGAGVGAGTLLGALSSAADPQNIGRGAAIGTGTAAGAIGGLLLAPTIQNAFTRDPRVEKLFASHPAYGTAIEAMVPLLGGVAGNVIARKFIKKKDKKDERTAEHAK